MDKRPCFGKDEKINKAWRKNGESIYLKHCVHCHTLVDREDWDRVVVGNVTKLSKIGTDQAMAWNSVNYMGWSGNFKDTYQETSVGDVVVEEHAPVLQILTAATRGVVQRPTTAKDTFDASSSGSTSSSRPSATTPSRKRASRKATMIPIRRRVLTTACLPTAPAR